MKRTGTTPNPFTCNGRDGVVDDGTGLYFMGTRYCAPELMRLIQEDQVLSGTPSEPQSLNRYAYVEGDPIRSVGPNGVGFLSTLSTFLAVAGIVIAVIGLAPGLPALAVVGLLVALLSLPAGLLAGMEAK